MDIEALNKKLEEMNYIVCEDDGVYIGPKWCIVDQGSQDYDILLEGTKHYHNRRDAILAAVRKLNMLT